MNKKEELIKRLEEQISFADSNGYEMDDISWDYQKGVLVTCNEAKLILGLVKEIDCKPHVSNLAVLKTKIMTKKDKIRLEVYQEILDDCKAMYSEYILDHIREQISILKYGI